MNISMNPNGELYQSAVNAPGAIEIPESFLNEARQFRELNMRYACAIREVKTKLEVLNDDLAIRNQRNPIQMIKSRVKKPESIIEKLHRRGFPISRKIGTGEPLRCGGDPRDLFLRGRYLYGG